MFSRMSGARILGALVVLLATVLVSYAPSPAQPLSGASRHRHDPAIIRERHGRNATSTNWSGYAVTGANGSVTDVKGSWIVPTVTDRKSTRLNSSHANISYAVFCLN